ncbi:MAG: NAD-glutamate dehydrogenase, partial [Sphingomonadaceae bacterium]|nr:NAD-glutamate dehydrogenase [Sphingomonadaceae bacterium]
PGQVPPVDEALLDARLGALVRGWGDSLEAALAEQAGATRAARLALSHGGAFSAAYQAQFGAADAATDVLRLTALAGDADRDAFLYRRDGDAPHQIRAKIYRLGQVIPLSDVVPVLEHFGLRVIEEYPFDLANGRFGWIHDFLLETADGSPVDLDDARARVEPALRAVLTGAQENDVFNALVLGVGLDARAVAWLRAYFRYLRQTGVAYGQATVVDALRRYPAIARDLIGLFSARFDPATESERGPLEREVNARLQAALANVQAIDDDRILRLYRRVIEATLRTNAFYPGGPEALAFKLDSSMVPNLPPPVPYREIWVYSPRVEGIHLRGGPIARGGLRWSDRRDDFRTEVLGLVKAQMVKNAVIVPTGAKGGFYPKQLPSPADRDAWLAEGTESYRVFIRALLSITDNLKDGAVAPPAFVVRHDADDPYLVVAADKGTATFSDIANAISEDQGFWLGDAFASGGRYGYDHKAMGITAKGAWISVQRHFREMGIDVQTDVVRVIGVGDMSGDVFGNGLLLSNSLKLVAAFDHRHTFLDPDPDPAASHAERARLFALPRSSWADYDAKLISTGGGVFPRDQKSLPLSAEVKAMLGVEVDELTPAELMQAILKSPADLCWFGGIGTYVKA